MSLFYCDICESQLERLYSVKQIEDLLKSTKLNDNPALNEILMKKYEYELYRKYICTNKKCRFIKDLSPFDIVKGFVNLKNIEGKKPSEIINEVDKKKEEFRKKYRKKSEGLKSELDKRKDVE